MQIECTAAVILTVRSKLVLENLARIEIPHDIVCSGICSDITDKVKLGATN